MESEDLTILVGKKTREYAVVVEKASEETRSTSLHDLSERELTEVIDAMFSAVHTYAWAADGKLLATQEWLDSQSDEELGQLVLKRAEGSLRSTMFSASQRA